MKLKYWMAGSCLMALLLAGALVPASAKDLLDMSDDLDRLDKQDFVSFVDKANACTRARNFSCSETELTKAQKVANDNHDRQMLVAARQNIADEKHTIAEEERQRAEAEARRREAEAIARRQAEEDGGFQWGKLAAIGVGAAIGGKGLNGSQIAQVAGGAVRDSQAGVQGLGSTQAALNQMGGNSMGAGNGGSGSGAGGQSEEERNRAAALACKGEANNVHPYNDGQLDGFCQLAAFNNCVKRRTGITAYDAETRESCARLKGSAKALQVNPNQCSACQ